ncbi:Cerato-platanin-domain-containing protein [Russula vinacea]|nr:Cerato-platanin-domain-containing protein [Russula vinacea]
MIRAGTVSSPTTHSQPSGHTTRPKTTIMKFFWSIIPLMAAFTSVSSDSLRYDPKYDDPEASTTTVTCSSKLISKGYNTFEEIPSYPNIGGANYILATPAECGSCWQLTNSDNDKSVYVTIIDATPESNFTASSTTIQTLQANPLYQTVYAKVVNDQEFCGITP